MSLEITGITKSYGRFPALDDVSLVAEDGEFIALLGPSGSGKTTLLRVIAGLEIADGGAVRFGGEDLLATPVRQRRIGFVFQHYALFKHMTVAQNIAFGMKSKHRRERPSKAAITAKVEELLLLVQLDNLGGRYPSQLSGGQRQRVALARALAIEPKILLLDEPFGALDAKVRRGLRRWLRELHERTGLTTIFSPTTRKRRWNWPTAWPCSRTAKSNRSARRKNSITTRPAPSSSTSWATAFSSPAWSRPARR
jgi:sulfate transport system ATP-binding protein